MKSINTPSAQIVKLDHSILRISYTEDYEITIKDIYEIEKACDELIPEILIYIITNTYGKFLNISTNVQKYLAKNSSLIPRLGASAIVIKNLPNRILAKYFINNINPQYPFKIFKSEEKALNWINNIIHNQKD